MCRSVWVHLGGAPGKGEAMLAVGARKAVAAEMTL